MRTMSDTLTFTGVSLKSFSRNSNHGSVTFAGNYPTKHICDEMGWGGMNPGQLSTKLEGDLNATHAILKPKEQGLAKHKVEIDITSLHSFQGIRLELEGHKGKGHRLEIRFQADFADTAGCAALEEYMVTVGEAKSTLTVSYVKQAAMEFEDQRDAQTTIEDD